jgi:hypothetical protein
VRACARPPAGRPGPSAPQPVGYACIRAMCWWSGGARRRVARAPTASDQPCARGARDMMQHHILHQDQA